MTPIHSVRYDTKLTAEVILTVAPRQVQADATAGARHEHNPGLLATLEDPDSRLALRERHVTTILNVHYLLLDQVVRDEVETRRPL